MTEIEYKVTLDKDPEVDIKNGLLIAFDRETDAVTKYAYADILQGQKEYDLPSMDKRRIDGIYLKIN